MSEGPHARTIFRDRALALAVIATAFLLYLPGLGALDLWAPDEPRFALVAEELRAMDDGLRSLVVLRLNGEVYTQKPPFYYWLAAAAGSASGTVTELAARLPSALAGIGCVAITLALGRTLFGAHSLAGIWGAAILLSTVRFAHMARRAQLDVILALLETLALWLFVRLEQKPNATPREVRATIAGLHLALGLATLTKGPVALLPLGVIALYLAWEGRLGSFKRIAPAWAWLLSLGPALAWICAAVALTPTGFFEETVVDNVVGRFFTGRSHARPFYYYFYQLPADFLPWTLLWPMAFACARGGLREVGAARRPWRLLTAWSLGMLVFFSFSAGKRGLYLVPAYPAIALLCGAGIEKLCSHRGALSKVGRGLVIVFAVATCGASLWHLSGGRYSSPELPNLDLPFSLGICGLAIAAGAVATAFRLRSTRVDFASAIGVVIAVELAMFHLFYPQLNRHKSPRVVAQVAEREAGADGRIAVFENRALTPGIAYYADRKIEELSDRVGLAAFADEDGGVVISRPHDLEALNSAGDFEVAESVRTGRRELVISRVVKRH